MSPNQLPVFPSLSVMRSKKVKDASGSYPAATMAKKPIRSASSCCSFSWPPRCDTRFVRAFSISRLYLSATSFLSPNADIFNILRIASEMSVAE